MKYQSSRNSRRHGHAGLKRVLVLVLSIGLLLPLLAACDRNRTADHQEYDLKDLRERRDDLGRISIPDDQSTTTTTTIRRLEIPDSAEVTSTTTVRQVVDPAPVETTTTYPPITEATTTSPPPTEPTNPPETETQKDPNFITVKFDTRGGTEIPSQTIRVGTSAEKPEDPVREGYTFTGWWIPGQDYPYDFSKTIWVDYVLTAGWISNDQQQAPEQGGAEAVVTDPPQVETDPPTNPPTDPPTDPSTEPVEDITPIEVEEPEDVEIIEPEVPDDQGEVIDPNTGDSEDEPVEPSEPDETPAGPSRTEIKPDLKPPYQAQTAADQEITSYVSRFLNYDGIQGTILLPPFETIDKIPSNWIVNYYLPDYTAQGLSTVLLADIEARAQEEINPNITLDPNQDYGSGYDAATASFNLALDDEMAQPHKADADTRITQVYDNGDGSISVEVTEFQFKPLSTRGNAGLITAQNSIVGYYDKNAATDQNPMGEFFFENAQTIAQSRYHLMPDGEGGYYLHSKTWNEGMSDGLMTVYDLNETTAQVTAGGSTLTIRAFADVQSADVGTIPDGTTVSAYSPSFNGMYLVFSMDGSFPPGYVSGDYLTVY